MKQILALCFLAFALACQASTYKTLMVDSDTRDCAQPVNFTNASLNGVPSAGLATDTEAAAAISAALASYVTSSTLASYATDTELAQGLAALSEDIAADTAALATHVGRADNPHAVTKAQLGLASVDDTPDTGKPVSIAQQAALDLKADTDSLNYIDAGDITSGTLDTARLPDGAAAGVYGSSTAIPVVTIDAKGRVTGATTAAVKGGHLIQADGTPLAARDNLNATGGLVATDDPDNNATKVSLPTTAYSMSFDSSDLVDSVLTVAHNLGDAGALSVAIKDGSGRGVVYPSEITYTDSDNLSIDFSGMDVAGTWTVNVIKAGGAGSGGGSATTDASLLTSGTLDTARLPDSGATAGSYTNASVTVDAKGRVTAASSGAASGGGMWTLVERWEPEAAATSHTFSGLDGDSDRNYLIRAYVVKANGQTGDVFMRPNNDSGNNYHMIYEGSSLGSATPSGIPLTHIEGSTTLSLSTCDFYAKSGHSRMSLGHSNRSSATTVLETFSLESLWANTTDNVTSIVVSFGTDGFGVGTCVELWKLAQ